MMSVNTRHSIQVHSGVLFDPFDPDLELINIGDIAHALSHQCRFSGHTSHFYSVALHSILMSHYCDPQDALWGLLHDASEAYLVDLPSPLKRHPEMEAYREAERLVMEAVAVKFGLAGPMPESVHKADRMLCVAEARELLCGTEAWIDCQGLQGFNTHSIEDVIRSWRWVHTEAVKQAFLHRFHELSQGAQCLTA
jgi:5'-deoxynucleotidase YfbR-like HD superfamily hydrolase